MQCLRSLIKKQSRRFGILPVGTQGRALGVGDTRASAGGIMLRSTPAAPHEPSSGPVAVDELSAPVRVPLHELRPGAQLRLEGEVLAHAHTLAGTDEPLAPIIVHRPTMRIIDGHHRRRAAQIRGDEEVLVRFFDGSATDAFVLAVQVNVMHGLPLSAQDRASAAGRILATCPDWSDRAIAAAAGLTAKTVAAIRRRETTADERSRPRLGSDGRVRPISNVEGRRRAGQLLQKNPDASLREVARRVGISPGTGRDGRDRLRRGEDVVPARRLPIPAERQPAEALVPPNPLVMSGVTLTIGQLRRDPSLRMTNFGRQLLRLLDLGVLPVLQMDQMVEMIPEHATPQVAMVARACALGWLRMADLLERRGQTHNPSTVSGISAAQA